MLLERARQQVAVPEAEMRVFDEDDLPRFTPRGRSTETAISLSLVVDLLTLVYTTHGHLEAMRATAMLRKRHACPTPAVNARVHVLPCRCLQSKRTASRKEFIDQHGFCCCGRWERWIYRT